MAILDCLFQSQYVTQSVSIPRTEATQPKTIVPISLGPQFEPTWRLSDVMGSEESLQLDKISGVSLLLASVLTMTCITLCACGSVFAAS